MRIRSMKPEFWREDIAALDWETRLLFIGLWSYVDDNSVGIDRLADIAADLFALDLERDPHETFARVSRGLQTLSDKGLIVRYEVDDRRWLSVVNFPKHQRIDKPNKARYPTPDQAKRESLTEPSRHSRETPAPGAGEQRSRGTEDKEHMAIALRPPATPDPFDKFWKTYPRREAKQAANKAWNKAAKTVDPRTIIAGAARYRDDPNRDPAFTAHAATWLNAGRWDDDPLPARNDRRRTADDKLADLASLVADMDTQPEMKEIA